MMKQTVLLLLAATIAAAAYAEPCPVSPSFSLGSGANGGLKLSLSESVSSAATYGAPSVSFDQSAIFVMQPVDVNSIAAIEHGSIVCHTAAVGFEALEPGPYVVRWINVITEYPLPQRLTLYEFRFTVDPPPDCTNVLTTEPRNPDSTAPFDVVFSNAMYWTPSQAVATIGGDLILVTERVNTTVGLPPLPNPPPCTSRRVTIPSLAQGSYTLRWHVFDETGRTIFQQVRHLDVTGPAFLGRSNQPPAVRRSGPVLVITDGAPGRLHVHYESQPHGALSASPQFAAQFVGSQLRVAQSVMFGDGETYPDDRNTPAVRQVEDFELPKPPPGDYTLLWNDPPMAFRVEPDLPATRCGLAYDAKFTFAGDRMLLSDFYSGDDPRFEPPAVVAVDGSLITVVQRVSDFAVQYNSTIQTTRCHEAVVALPPLAPGAYDIAWHYLINQSELRPAFRVTKGRLDVNGRRRASGH
jgi:hypothetical protein